MDRTRLASGEMTGQHSNQLNYRSILFKIFTGLFRYHRKYFLLHLFILLSSISASAFVSNALTNTNFHGILDLVNLLSPPLCSANLL